MPVVATRAFRTRMKAANRIPRSLELRLKCRIRANRLCGSTTARSRSTAKKLRNYGNKPRGNPQSPQKRTRDNVQSSNLPLLHLTFSVRPSHVDSHVDYHPCFPSRSVFLSTTITLLTTPPRATSLHALIIVRSPGLDLPLRVCSPGGYNTMFRCVFRLALLVTVSFLHIRSLSVSCPSCCPIFEPIFSLSPSGISPYPVA